MPIKTSHEFVNAKLHGMKSAMAEGPRLYELLRARDLDDLARVLFAGQTGGQADAQLMERRLTEAYFADLGKVRLALGEADQQFFAGFLRKADLENVKVLWRYSQNQSATARDVRKLLVTTRSSPDLPVDGLLAAESPIEFTERLVEADLKRELTQILAAFPGAPQPFLMDTGLDRFYFRQLMDGTRWLKRRDRQVALELLGLDVDIAVLLWTLRLRQNYDIEPDLLVSLFAPLTTHIGKTRLKALCDAVDEPQRRDAIPRPYRTCLQGVDLADVPKCEQRLYSFMDRMARRHFRRMTNDLAGVVGFYFLKRAELINLIRVVQAARYGLSEDEAKTLLLPSTE